MSFLAIACQLQMPLHHHFPVISPQFSFISYPKAAAP
jgi:hypothetical protein